MSSPQSRESTSARPVTLAIGFSLHLRPYLRWVLGGIMRYVRSHTDWQVFLLHGIDGQAESADTYQPGRQFDGLITGVTPQSRNKVANMAVPTVVVGSEAMGMRHPWVGVDYAQVVRAGVSYLQDHGWRRVVAFTHWYHRRPNIRRFIQGFRDTGGEEDRLFCIGRRTADRGYWAYEDQQADLIDFLRRQSLPVGVVTHDEEHAWRVVNAATTAGWRMPRDVGIISLGIDHDLAELIEPTITTIPIDHDAIGFAAAEVMAHLLRGEPAPAQTFVAPGRVIERASTGIAFVDNPDVAAAMQFIEEHLHDPIGIDDVATAVLVSPRTLHRKFNTHLGMTPRDMIRFSRIRQAKLLLVETHRSIAHIATACGMGPPSQFSRDFRKATGLTPARYRAQHKTSSG